MTDKGTDFMRKLICCALLVCLFSGTQLFGWMENAKPYVGLHAGPVIDNDHTVSALGTITTDTGFGIGALLGYDFGLLRSEIEVMYRKAYFDRIKPDGGSITISGKGELWTYMLNVMATLPIDSSVKPFAGIGIGAAECLANATINNPAVSISSTDSANDTAFAYQGIIGATWKASPETVLDLSYRYLGTSNFNLKGHDANYGSQSMLVGVRYFFK